MNPDDKSHGAAQAASRPILEARAVSELTPGAAATLADVGLAAYSVARPETAKPKTADGADLRSQPRARTRLRSAKLIDAASAFLCEALIQDLSPGGMRLRLARNIGLPARFGIHDDDSGALYTVSQAWRRGLSIGVRIHRSGPPSPMKLSERAALAGRYYGMRS